MTNPLPPDDRIEPSEQPIRARVPEHVSRGAFSTGVIIMTQPTEIILDFVQNLGRPYQVVARIIMPHHVLPQLVDALHRNMDLYRGRWGELPVLPQLPPIQGTVTPTTAPSGLQTGQENSHTNSDGPALGANLGQAPAPSNSSDMPAQQPNVPANQPLGNQSNPTNQPANDPNARRPSAQEIYDDLKIRDELLSGAYSNAVMIGHGPHEFSFDFITNFYPYSAVSSRVFLSAGQVVRLYDSLRGTLDQLRLRLPPQ